MTLTVPKAGVFAGAAPSLRFDRDTTGDTIAAFGDRMVQINAQLQQEREQRGLNRARVQMMSGLNDLQTEFDQIGDPDVIDSQYVQRADALRESIVADLPDGIREQAGLVFDEMAVPHIARQGRRAIDQRQSAEMAHVMGVGEELVRTAAIGDMDQQAAFRDHFDEQLGDLIQRGVMRPDQAQRIRMQIGGQMESARATRMLSDDPDALVAAIDEGEFTQLGGDGIQGWRARAVTQSRTRAAQVAAAAERARNEYLSEMGDIAKDGAAVLRKGQPFARDAELRDALADPEVAAKPEVREYLATAALFDARPELAAMTPEQKRGVLAELEGQAAGKDYEIAPRDTLRDLIKAEDEALAKDPLGYWAATLKDPLPGLPDPGSAAPEEIGAALSARRRRAVSLVEAGRATAAQVKIFTPEEREAWSDRAAPEASPQARAAVAQSMASALGPLSRAAMAEISDDPVFVHVGSGLAAGMDQKLGRQIFEGQRVIAGKQVKLPSEPQRRQAFFGEVSGLFPDGTDKEWSDQAGVRDQIIDSADALYAYRMRGKVEEGGRSGSADPEIGVLDQGVYLQAVHEVMGGTGTYNAGMFSRGKPEGGLQRLNGALTIMPRGVSAGDVKARLTHLGKGGGAIGWAGISPSGAIPQVGGEAPDETTMNQIRLRAVGPDPQTGDDLYVMIRQRPDGAETVVMGDDGLSYNMSMQKLLAVQP